MRLKLDNAHYHVRKRWNKATVLLNPSDDLTGAHFRRNTLARTKWIEPSYLDGSSFPFSWLEKTLFTKTAGPINNFTLVPLESIVYILVPLESTGWSL